MKVIVISGTPGTGKTALAKQQAKKLGYLHINLNPLIKEQRLYENFNRKKQTYDVDIKKINKLLIKIIEYEKKSNTKGIIIDSHLSHYLPKKYVNACIITKTELKTLKKRLEARKYSKEKVRENLDSEIFDICLNEAIENKHNLIVIDTTKPINIKYLLAKLKWTSKQKS